MSPMDQVHGPVFPRWENVKQLQRPCHKHKLCQEGLLSIVTSLWGENGAQGTRTSFFVGPHRKSCLMIPLLRGIKTRIIPATQGGGKREHRLTSDRRKKASAKTLVYNWSIFSPYPGRTSIGLSEEGEGMATVFLELGLQERRHSPPQSVSMNPAESNPATETQPT